MTEITEISAADVTEAEKFRRGHGGKYDRVIAMLTAAFARHRQAALIEGARLERERIAAIMTDAIESGYPTPPNKADKCEHDKYGWEECIACYDEHLFKAIRSLSPAEVTKP